MHLGSWERTREATEALGFASCHSNASLVLSQLPACIHNSIDARQALDHFFNRPPKIVGLLPHLRSCDSDLEDSLFLNRLSTRCYLDKHFKKEILHDTT